MRYLPLSNIFPNNILIIEDMNAQIGKDENNKFCLHNLSNRNEEYLANFLLKNRLKTKFLKKWRENYGPTPNQNNSKAQLDYIVINKKWINSIMNCEAYSSFAGVSSNHQNCQSKDTTESMQK